MCLSVNPGTLSKTGYFFRAMPQYTLIFTLYYQFLVEYCLFFVRIRQKALTIPIYFIILVV